MATQPRSTICDFDFKLQLKKHFEKVYYKCVDNKMVQEQMLDQSARIWVELHEASGGRKLSKLFKKAKLTAWVDFLMNQPTGAPNESTVRGSESVAQK
jgi:hypothetical protein